MASAPIFHTIPAVLVIHGLYQLPQSLRISLLISNSENKKSWRLGESWIRDWLQTHVKLYFYDLLWVSSSLIFKHQKNWRVPGQGAEFRQLEGFQYGTVIQPSQNWLVQQIWAETPYGGPRKRVLLTDGQKNHSQISRFDPAFGSLILCGFPRGWRLLYTNT